MSISISNLPKTVEKKKKRLGRGHGSGRGMKSGRGTTRHQTAREKVPLHFEGGQSRMVKKYPLLRGKGRNKPHSFRSLTLRLKDLNVYNDGETVSIDTLIEKGLVTDSARKKNVKVILSGELTKKLTVSISVTPGAQKAIEKAGGNVASV
jgi:large subunit ribosomal protein L15